MGNIQISKQDWKGNLLYGDEKLNVWLDISSNGSVTGVLWKTCYTNIQYSHMKMDHITHYVVGKVTENVLELIIQKTDPNEVDFEKATFVVNFNADKFGKMSIEEGKYKMIEKEQ